MIQMNTDVAWLRAKAEAEDNGIVSVGGLVGALAKRAEESKAHLAERIALAKLVELRRRQYRLSAEDLAKKADVDLEDVVSLERGEGTVPEPRTMHRLAQALELPEPRLLELAGLVPAKDVLFRKATVRFARARSRSPTSCRRSRRRSRSSWNGSRSREQQSPRLCRRGAFSGKLRDGITQGPSGPGVGRAGITNMNNALTDDLHRLLRMRVENGQFPNEKAVVEEALRLFLTEGPDNGQPPAGTATESQKDDDEDARPWRGVYALEFPEEVLFTKPIDIRPEQLDEWRPQGVTSERRDRDEDE